MGFAGRRAERILRRIYVNNITIFLENQAKKEQQSVAATAAAEIKQKTPPASARTGFIGV